MKSVRVYIFMENMPSGSVEKLREAGIIEPILRNPEREKGPWVLEVSAATILCSAARLNNLNLNIGWMLGVMGVPKETTIDYEVR